MMILARSIRVLPPIGRYFSFRCYHLHSSSQTSGYRSFSMSTSLYLKSAKLIDVEELLSTPSWSVESLLPPENITDAETSITSVQLHHLLRLSALPPPESAEEESRMLKTLSSQLHFVREIQRVDTTGVEPLRSIRDETATAEGENIITVAKLGDAFSKEEVIGKHYKRIRRKEEPATDDDTPKDWRPLDHAHRKAGRYFVVENNQASKK